MRLPRTEVLSTAAGLHLAAVDTATRGTTVLDLSNGTPVSSPTRTSIFAGGQHIEHREGAYVNHSCTPSCAVIGLELVALRDLAPGDAVTFNYLRSEVGELASPFCCFECGAELKSASERACGRYNA